MRNPVVGKIRRERLEILCAARRPIVRRLPPANGYDVTIYRGPHYEPVDLVVEAHWHDGCCVSFDCPGEPAGWDFGQVWFKRRGTWREVKRLSDNDWRQIKRELGDGSYDPY